jgi:hypothetical protein
LAAVSAAIAGCAPFDILVHKAGTNRPRPFSGGDAASALMTGSALMVYGGWTAD